MHAPAAQTTNATIPLPVASAAKYRGLVILAWVMLIYAGLMGRDLKIPHLPYVNVSELLNLWAPTWGPKAASFPIFRNIHSHSLCLFQRCTGLPCVFCGMTRSFARLSQGDWQTALQYHLLGIPFYAATWWIALSGLLRPALTQASLRLLQNKRVLALILLTLIACWIWKLTQSPVFW